MSRRTRRLPVNNRRQGPRHRNRRTPRPSTAEWSCPTASRVEGALGTWRRAARPAPAISTGGSVLTKTACMASGRTAGGNAKTKGRATSWSWTILVLRHRSRPRSRRRPRRANQIFGLHAIDATPARWRGDAGSSALDGTSVTTWSSPRSVPAPDSPVHRTQAGTDAGAVPRAHDEQRHDRCYHKNGRAPLVR